MGEDQTNTSTSLLLIRGAVGGALMGLANLVPGISGGTMLLAAGIYPRFIAAMADVTRLRWKGSSLAVLAAVGGAAVLAILLLAGQVKDLVISHRWIMYSLFIGLTLGGVPIVRGLLGRLDRSAHAGIVSGCVGMVMLAWFQSSSGANSASHETFPWMFGAGVAGAGAMILPGVSGGYLLLVMGVYIPILSGIDDFKAALQSSNFELLMSPLFAVVIPVGLGVAAGVVAVSNGLKWCLENHKKFTLGALLGLLLGAVVGLYPFQAGTAPQLGDLIKGKTVTAENIEEFEPEDWPTEFFRPELLQIAGSLAMISIGFALTSAIRVFGRDRE